MSEKYKFLSQTEIYFTTTTVVDWVDVFTRPDYALIVIKSLQHCIDEKGLRVHAWCLMSNHLHMLVSSKEGFLLEHTFRDFKKFTSKKIVGAIKEMPESRRDWMLNRFEYAGRYLNRIKDYKFWQDGNHPVICENSEMLDQKLHYIHNNPVKRMLVYEPEHYPFSSAIDYAGVKGMLDIDLIR